MVATGALSLPKQPDRLAMQANLLSAGRVAEIVADAGGDEHYLLTGLRLKERYGITMGGALAAIRRAILAGDVMLDGSDLVVVRPPRAA